jgi:hypothetical protein
MSTVSAINFSRRILLQRVRHTMIWKYLSFFITDKYHIAYLSVSHSMNDAVLVSCILLSVWEGQKLANRTAYRKWCVFLSYHWTNGVVYILQKHKYAVQTYQSGFLQYRVIIPQPAIEFKKSGKVSFNSNFLSDFDLHVKLLQIYWQNQSTAKMLYSAYSLFFSRWWWSKVKILHYTQE